MIILSLDTTCKIASCALTNDDVLIEQTTLISEKTHSETILSEIDKLFKKSNLNINDVKMFALTVGPGSFTGVRVGVSLIKGLDFNKDLPCVGVSTLLSLAENVRHLSGHFIVSPVMDARRNQLYNALFEIDDHNIKRLTNDNLISASDLNEELKKYSLPVCFVGDGYKIMENIYPNSLEVDPSLKNNSAYSVSKVAYYEYISENDKSKYNDIALKPLYLRASQAEREYNDKENKS